MRSFDIVIYFTYLEENQDGDFFTKADEIKELLRDFGCRTPLVGLAGKGGVYTPDYFIGQRDLRLQPSKPE